MEFGLGAPGSEQTIVACPINQLYETEPWFTLPLLLPAGQVLSARVKFNMASAADAYPDFHLYAGQSFVDSTPRQRAATYGLTNSSGQQVATGAAGGYGSWVELTSASTNRVKQMVVCVQPNTPNSGGGGGDALIQIDVGVGNTGNAVDRIVFDKLYTYYQGGRTLVPNSIGPLPCDLPAGTRIAARAASPNHSGIAYVNVSVIGVD